jgi:hypothetical protein
MTSRELRRWPTIPVTKSSYEAAATTAKWNRQSLDRRKPVSADG